MIGKDLAKPVEITLDGTTWKFSRINQDIKAALEEYMCGKVRTEAIGWKGLVSQDDYLALLLKTNQDIASGKFSLGSPDWNKFLANEKGLLKLMAELVQAHQPKATEDELRALLVNYGDEIKAIILELFSEYQKKTRNLNPG